MHPLSFLLSYFWTYATNGRMCNIQECLSKAPLHGLGKNSVTSLYFSLRTANQPKNWFFNENMKVPLFTICSSLINVLSVLSVIVSRKFQASHISVTIVRYPAVHLNGWFDPAEITPDPCSPSGLRYRSGRVTPRNWRGRVAHFPRISLIWACRRARSRPSAVRHGSCTKWMTR